MQKLVCTCSLCVVLTGVVIGLGWSVYSVVERPGAMQRVCAVVKTPRSGCSVTTPISLEISTRDDTAGIVYITALCV